MPNDNPITHHALSPSSFPAWSACACFESGEAGPDAERGTLQHAAVREIVEIAIWNDPDRPAPTWDQLTEAERDNVEWVVGKLTEYFSVEQLKAAKWEQRVTVLDDDFNVVTYGTADFIVPGIICDLKFGLERDYSAQMAAYALGEMQRLGTKSIAVTILYGRLRKGEPMEIRYDDAKRTVDSIIARRADPERRPVPCDYCGWCAKAATCPALIETALTVAAGRGEAAPAEITTYHPSEVTDPEQMALLLRLADQMEAFAKSVKFHGKALAASGADIPGWTLKDRKGKTGVADVMTAYELTGLDPAAFIGACSVSIPKLAKAFGAARNLKTAAARRELEKTLNGVLTFGAPSKVLTKIGGASADDEETQGESDHA